MSISFSHRNKTVRMSWFDADQMLTVLHDLELSLDPNELIDGELTDSQAAEIAGLLEEALRTNRIGVAETRTDSLGREFTVPLRAVVVGGKSPLSDGERAWVERFIDMCKRE